MRLIAITLPEFFDGEAASIVSLLTDGGYWRVHIRKPGATARQLTDFLRARAGQRYNRGSLTPTFLNWLSVSVSGAGP